MQFWSIVLKITLYIRLQEIESKKVDFRVLILGTQDLFHYLMPREMMTVKRFNKNFDLPQIMMATSILLPDFFTKPMIQNSALIRL